MRVLVTGGAGYIGSHVALELLDAGHEVSVIDDLSNGSMEAVRRVEEISGSDIDFHFADLNDAELVNGVMQGTSPEACIHLAGFKSVSESLSKPAEYYRNNVAATFSLVDGLREQGVRKIIFSSSATVYGVPELLPLREDSAVGIGLTNAYGRTKFINELYLRDLAAADSNLEVTLLRYFNPVGAHPSGRIGEDPAQIPNNLLPYVSQVAVGRLDHVSVFGNTYPTPDGTGLRDYIHVVDLARGHVAALEHSKAGVNTYNLGTGQAVSVLEAIAAFSRVSGRPIPHEIVEARDGDVAEAWADVSLAARELGWEARYSFEEACAHAWEWQRNNPSGYGQQVIADGSTAHRPR